MKFGVLGSLAAASAIASVLAAVSPASAATFDWSLSGPDIVGSGTLTTLEDQGPVFDVTGISGTVNGATILGLSNYFYPEQVVFSPQPENPVVDASGLSFSVGDGSISYMVYEDNGIYAPGYLDCGATYCIIGPAHTDMSTFGLDKNTALASLTLTRVADPTFVRADVATVPEPSTWAMMGLGFAGLGVAALRKRRALKTA
jgi:PEP-CTERM motif